MMSLKITAALILALVAHSSAFVVKTRRNDAPKVPGFTFEHEKLKVTAPDGDLFFTPGFLNNTAYKYSSADDIKTIGFETIIPSLAIFYKKTVVENDGKKTEGEIIGYATNSTYRLSFSAGGGDSKVGVKIEAVSAIPTYIAHVGENSDVFKQPAVVKKLTSALAKVLATVDKVVGELFEKALPKLLDVDELYKQLRASDEKTFPEPLFY